MNEVNGNETSESVKYDLVADESINALKDPFLEYSNEPEYIEYLIKNFNEYLRDDYYEWLYE